MMKKTLLSAVSALAILMGGSLAMAQDQDDTAPPATGAGETTDSDSGTGATTGDTDSGGAATDTPGTSMPDAGEETPTTTAPSDTTTPPATTTTPPAATTDTTTPSETTTPIDLTQLHPYDGDPTGIMVEGVPAEDVVGGTLVNQNGEKIASINDLLVDSNGEPQGLLVGFGGFLGLMEKTVAIGFDRVDLTPNEDNEYRTDLTEEEIEALPEYEEPET